MSYSDLYFGQQKKPSLILIGVALISLVGFVSFFLKSGNITPSKATKVIRIASQSIVNLSPQEAGIFWQTEGEQTSEIVFGESKLDRFAFDERDIGTTKKTYNNHYVILRNLSENKQYFYRIVASDGVFPNPKEKPFSFTTPQKKTIRSSLMAAYGKVTQIDAPAEGAFVFFNFGTKYYPILAITKLDGSFVIPLNYLVDVTTNEITIPNEKEVVSVEIFDKSRKTKIKAFLNQTQNFPTIRLGGTDRDLTQETQVLSAVTTREVSYPKEKSKITIIYPKENSVVPGQKPLIKGTALANKEVIVAINSSPEYVFRTQSNAKGEWKVVPTAGILAGDYKLSVTSEDETGNKIFAEQNFSIAKSGEQVLGEATAEPTLVQPTNLPTVIPTSDINQYITPTAAPPKTGFNNNWLMVISSLFIIGGLLVLRGRSSFF